MERKIMFDCDGVLADSETPVVEDINSFLADRGIEFRFVAGQTLSWDHHKETIIKLTKDEQLADLAESYWFNADTLFRSPPCDGAARIFGRLILAGYEPWIVTSRDPNRDKNMRIKTIEWAGVHLPFHPQERIRIRENDDPRGGNQFKGDVFMELGPKYVIDDDYRTLLYIEKLPDFDSKRTKLVLMTREWNRTKDLHLTRVNSLQEFWEKIVEK